MKKEYIIIIAVILLIVLLYAGNKILQKLGIVPTAKDIEINKLSEKLETQSTKLFNPVNYKNEQFKKLSTVEAKTYAEKIHKAIKGLGTDEQTIFNTFANLPNKNCISQIAEAYYLMYNKDLLADINNDLTKTEKAKLQAIIDNLPNI